MYRSLLTLAHVNADVGSLLKSVQFAKDATDVPIGDKPVIPDERREPPDPLQPPAEEPPPPHHPENPPAEQPPVGDPPSRKPAVGDPPPNMLRRS